MSEAKTEFHAIVEVMGHRKYAGLVTEQVLGGASFVRVDVPAVGDQPAFSKLFGAGSIYCISPVSEAIANAMAQQCGEKPVSVYDLPEEWQRKIHAKALPSPAAAPNEDYEEYPEYDEDELN